MKTSEERLATRRADRIELQQAEQAKEGRTEGRTTKVGVVT